MGQGDKILFFGDGRKSVFEKMNILTLINIRKCMRRKELEKVGRQIGCKGGDLGCSIACFM
jgi:hypothetical protein